MYHREHGNLTHTDRPDWSRSDHGYSQSEGCERGYLILVRVGMGPGPWGRVGGVGGGGDGVGGGGVGGHG